MNIRLLKKLSKKYPGFARAINLSILAGISSVIMLLIHYVESGEAFNFTIIAGNFLVAFLGGIEKFSRDLQNG